MSHYNEHGMRRRLADGDNVGIFLRAARNGFFYSDRHQGYLRLSWQDEEKATLLVEYCSPAEIRERTGKASSGLHILWADENAKKKHVESALPFTAEQIRQSRTMRLRAIDDKFEAASR